MDVIRIARVSVHQRLEKRNRRFGGCAMLFGAIRMGVKLGQIQYDAHMVELYGRLLHVGRG